MDVSILILNAGVLTFGGFSSLAPSTLASQLGTNLYQVAALTKLFLPQLLARKPRRAALIVNSSASAMKWFPNALLYSSTKAFVTSFTKGLALELQGSNVDLQCLEPFAVATNITDHWGIKTVGTTCDKVIKSSLDNLGKNPLDI